MNVGCCSFTHKGTVHVLGPACQELPAAAAFSPTHRKHMKLPSFELQTETARAENSRPAVQPAAGKLLQLHQLLVVYKLKVYKTCNLIPEGLGVVFVSENESLSRRKKKRKSWTEEKHSFSANFVCWRR